MLTRAAIVEEARRWVGTAYHHQGRCRAGVDCAGLVVAVACALGLPVLVDLRGYGLAPEGDRLRQTLLANGCTEIPSRGARPGDILLFRFTRLPQHLGIVSDLGVIHAHARRQRVVEHRLADVWRARIVGAFAFPGVAD